MKKIILLLFCSFLSSYLTGQKVNLGSERLSEGDISVEDLYIAANQKRLLNKYDEALEIYQKILKNNTVNASAHHDMAKIYLAQDDEEKAVSAARKAIRYGRSNHWYQLTLAEIYEKYLRYNEAANTIGDVIKMVSDEGLYIRRVEYLDLAERKLDAIAALDKAEMLFGSSELRSDTKVDLLLDLGKQKEAIKEVAKWTAKYPKSITYWTKLARFYAFLNLTKQSRKTYEKVLSLDVNDEEALVQLSTQRKKNDSPSGLAVLIEDKRIGIDNKVKAILPFVGNPKRQVEMVDLCSSLVQQYPENAKSYALLADVYWLNGEVDLAIENYTNALKINKSVYQVWDQLMMALSHKKEYDKLGDLSDEALDYYPNQAGPYYYKALSLVASGNFEEGSEMNDEALFISVAGSGYIAEQARILKASNLDRQGKTKNAIDYIESIDQDQLTAALYEVLGDLYLKYQDKSNAEKAWLNSISKGGDKSRIEMKIQSI